MKHTKLLTTLLALSVSAVAASLTASAEGTMIIGSPQSSETLDPENGYDYWYMLRYGVCETPMGFNEDMTPYGWLFEDEYTLAEDNLTWTFKVRDGVTFSNGKTVDAEAVKSCMERTLADVAIAGSYVTVTSMEANGQELTIVTEKPQPTLPYILADPVFVIYDVTEDLSNAADEGVIGTGPFVFDSFDPISFDTNVVRNENYWGGDVILDEIDFRIIKDTSALAMGLQTGDFDAAYSLAATDIVNFTDVPEFNVITSASGRTDLCFMNQNEGKVLSDEVLRQAIMRSVDRETICAGTLNSMFVAGKTPLTSSLPYGYDELNDINAYDPEGAAKLLDDAGYVDADGDGLRDMPDGSPLSISITVYPGRAEIPTFGEVIQMYCAANGLDVQVVQLDQGTAWTNLTSGEYDMLIMSISLASSGDPENGLRSYWMTHTEENGNYNASGYSNQKVDDLLAELHEEFDKDRRIEIVKEIEQILMDESATFYLCYPIMNFVTKNNVEGVTSHTSDYYWVSKDTCFTS